MSQHGPALKVIAEESGLKGKLLRPLSAKLLPETVAEKKGLVDRNSCLAFKVDRVSLSLSLPKNMGLRLFLHLQEDAYLLAKNTKKSYAISSKTENTSLLRILLCCGWAGTLGLAKTR